MFLILLRHLRLWSKSNKQADATAQQQQADAEQAGQLLVLQ